MACNCGLSQLITITAFMILRKEKKQTIVPEINSISSDSIVNNIDCESDGKKLILS